MRDSSRVVKGKRDIILRFLRRNPGSSIDMISQGLEMNRGTLRYHLDLLKMDQLVLVKEISNRMCYFSMEPGKMEKNLNTSLSLEEERILVMLKSDPGMTRNDLKKILNIASSGITRSIRSLKVKGKIWEMNKGRSRRFFVVSREMVIDEMILDLVEMFLDGRIDETRFQVLKKKLLEEKDREK